ncbi:MAG: type II toxin-antitoxin system Phd/YefM family antitoxin [Alphaproteobacteria bacterium]|nr:type II toxin-antitoxin system Phd/YefM family antitoxin [Alphaproteobacteria bacterium]
MIHVRATDAKNQFGKLLDNAQHEAVLIEKNGRDIAVVLSNTEYQRLRIYEDELWQLKAQMAKSEGFHSENESETLLESFLDAKD